MESAQRVTKQTESKNRKRVCCVPSTRRSPLEPSGNTVDRLEIRIRRSGFLRAHKTHNTQIGIQGRRQSKQTGGWGNRRGEGIISDKEMRVRGTRAQPNTQLGSKIAKKHQHVVEEHDEFGRVEQHPFDVHSVIRDQLLGLLQGGKRTLRPNVC